MTKSGDFHSQFGEDRLLASIFAGKTDGFFVEVGAYDGVDLSNTYHFEKAGWRGVLVEPDPAMAESCRQRRNNSIVVEAAAVAPGATGLVPFQVVEGWPALSSLSVSHVKNGERLANEFQSTTIQVAARTLDEILTDCAVERIDFMTIDVEGGEWGVLAGFSIDRWKPLVVIVERSSASPDRRIVAYMHAHGYRHVRTTGGINDWFRYSGSPPGRWYQLLFFLGTELPARVVERILQPLRRQAKMALKRLGLLEAAKALRLGRRN